MGAESIFSETAKTAETAKAVCGEAKSNVFEAANVTGKTVVSSGAESIFSETAETTETAKAECGVAKINGLEAAGATGKRVVSSGAVGLESAGGYPEKDPAGSRHVLLLSSQAFFALESACLELSLAVDFETRVMVSICRKLIGTCNMYTCSGNCIQERSAGFPIFSFITLLTLISLIVLQPWSYIRAR